MSAFSKMISRLMKPQAFAPFLVWLSIGVATPLVAQNFTKEMVAGVILLDKPGLTRQECLNIIDRFPKTTPGKSYSPEEVATIRNALENGANILGAPPKPEEPAKPDRLWGIKIRQNYDDVTGEEDPTSKDPKERRDQLAGAAFSYSRDFKNDRNNWSAQGAIIRPFRIYENLEGVKPSDPPLLLREAFIVPSVSLHKVSSGTDPDDDVDSLIYRLGGVTRFAGTSPGSIQELELRGYATYGTDTSHETSTVAGEFDIEPRFAGREEEAKWALGFPASLSGRSPSDKDGNSNFLYHLRTYIHGEFGEVQDADNDPDIQEGDFFRLGPVAKLELQPCALARALGKKYDGIRFYTSYSLLPTIGGADNGHDYLFSVGLDWSLFEEDDQSVSLKLLYEKGGIDLTKEEVDSFTLGLGVTF